MKIEEIIITPAIAKTILDKNINNRPLSKARVAFLSSVMKRGEWQYNGDTIRVAKSGRLLDGQHRLSAIEMSGIPQKYIVVTGLADEVFTTIDIGSARTASQMVAMSGQKNAAAKAATAKLYLTWRMHGRPVHGSPDKKPTHTQIIDFCEDRPELDKAVHLAIRNWPKRHIAPSHTAFCYYVFNSVDSVSCDAFFQELQSGETSYPDSPVRFLRDLIIEETGKPSRPDSSRRIALIFKAFRIYRKKQPSKILRLSKDQTKWYEV